MRTHTAREQHSRESQQREHIESTAAPLPLPPELLPPELLPPELLLLELLLTGPPAAARAISACTKPQPDRSFGLVLPIGEALERNAM